MDHVWNTFQVALLVAIDSSLADNLTFQVFLLGVLPTMGRLEHVPGCSFGSHRFISL